MKKILIFSDSHRDMNAVTKAVQDTQPDFIICAGDFQVSDAKLWNAFGMIPAKVVTGNCDTCSDQPYEDSFTVEGVRFFLTHSHRYHNAFWDMCIKDAKHVKADVVVFGHIHRLCRQYVDEILFLNPGSISRPYSSDPPSYMVMEITEPGKYMVDIRFLTNSALKQEHDHI